MQRDPDKGLSDFSRFMGMSNYFPHTGTEAGLGQWKQLRLEREKPRDR